MTDENRHPEQDPAEGSRETVERDLERQEKSGQHKEEADDESPVSSPGAEAAEPSPE